MKIECPICEHRFSIVAKNSGNMVRCPGCRKEIDWKSARLSEESASSTPDSSAVPPIFVAPQADIPEPRRTHAPGELSAQPTPPLPSSGNELSQESTSSEPSWLQARRVSRHQRSRRRYWIAGSLLIVVCLGGWLAVQLPAWNDGQSTEAQDEKQDSENVGTLLDSLKRPAESAASEQKPLDLKPEFFSQEERRRVWKLIHPFIVQLRVESPQGESTVTGLLIDSRGWVLTSYHHLENASRVHVHLAAKNRENSQTFEGLEDEARGIVASDPAHDLILIAINRAQVRSLTDAPLSENVRVVESYRGALIRTPPPRFQDWFVETRVGSRQDLASFSKAFIRKLTANQRALNETTKWIVHQSSPPSEATSQFAGSVFVNQSGQIIGLNTAYHDERGWVTVPAQQIRQFVDSVTTETISGFPNQSLARNTNDTLPKPEGKEQKQESKRGQAKGRRSENDSEFSAVETLVEQCEALQWKPGSQDDYEKFQQLSEAFAELQQWYDKQPRTGRKSKLARKRLNELKQSIKESFYGALAEDKQIIDDTNRWFSEAVSETNPWLLIWVEVVSGATSSPAVQGRETVLVRFQSDRLLDENQRDPGQLLAVLFDPDGKIMRPGQRMVLLGRITNQLGDDTFLNWKGERLPILDMTIWF